LAIGFATQSLKIAYQNTVPAAHFQVIAETIPEAVTGSECAGLQNESDGWRIIGVALFNAVQPKFH
jgi:hypothetical protein